MFSSRSPQTFNYSTIMKFPFYLLACLGLLFVGCLKIPDEVIDTQAQQVGANNFDELVAPSGYNFSTSFQQEITLIAIRRGAPLKGVIFYLYTAPPARGGKVIDKGITDEKGEYRTTIEIAHAKKAIYAYTPYGDFAPSQRLEITGAPIEHVWGSGPVPSDGALYRLASFDSTLSCDPSFYQVIMDTLKKLDVLTGTYTSLGKASTNYNGIGYNLQDKLLYGFKGSNLWRLKNDGIETDLGTISNFQGTSYIGDFDTLGNLWTPKLAGGNWTLTKVDVDLRPLTGVTSNLTVTGGNPSGFHDMAYNSATDKFYGVSQSGADLIEIDHKALTIRTLASFSDTAGRGAFGAVWCEGGGDIFFSQNTTGKIFLIDMDPNTGLPLGITTMLDGEGASNNDGASCTLAPSPFLDTDGDGVPNGNDDYWQDPTATTKGFLPDRNSSGTYAFEDFWPKRGDYDFNDLVVDYAYEFRKNADNKIVVMDISLRVQAVGAGFQIGFGLQLDDLISSQISNITGTDATSITTSSNGCESGQSKAVIICFDNAHEVLGQRVGRMINVSDSSYTADPVTLEIEVYFTDPIDAIGTINPFIYVKNDRGREIHLKGYTPTDLVNSALFNTEADASSGSDTYQTANGLPWALNLIESFNWPIEKTDVLTAYPKLKENVTSGGTREQDWYSTSKRIPGKVRARTR